MPRNSKKGAALEPPIQAPNVFDKVVPSEPEIPIYVMAPKHSKAFRRLSENGVLTLPDGQRLAMGVTVKTVQSSELDELIKAGALLAGKA